MNIAIVGTGYVGLVSGTCFAEMGVNVTCVDVNQAKIESLQKGEIPIYEPGLDEMVLRNQREGRLNFTTDLASVLDNVEMVFSAVGTPPDEDGSADLQYVLAVARTFGQNIKKYTVLVTKSTVPVGTAKKVKAAIQEELDKRGVNVPFDVASNPRLRHHGLHETGPRCRGCRKRTGQGTHDPPLPPDDAQQLPRDFHGHPERRNDQVRRELHARDPHQLHERHREPLRTRGCRREHGPQGHR